MEINLKRMKGASSFVAKNKDGHSIHLSGEGDAVGPMESVLMAVAGCSSIDVVMILERMRQNLEDIEVKVVGTRRDEIPRYFTKINLHFIVTGNLKEKKVKEAIDLSIEKYCSVSKMLEKAVEITTSYEIKSSVSG